jgi:hypothetical protein
MSEHPPAHGRTTPTPTTESGRYRSGLAEVEREGDGRPVFILSRTELKLLGIAGVREHRLNVTRISNGSHLLRLGSSWMVDGYLSCSPAYIIDL